MLLLVGCNTTKKSQGDEPSPVSATFNADSAYLFCQQQCDFGPRTMNSEAHERCAEWIQQRFTQYGYQVEMQRADLRGYDGTTLKATNIIAISSAPIGTVGRGLTTTQTLPTGASPCWQPTMVLRVWQSCWNSHDNYSSTTH